MTDKQTVAMDLIMEACELMGWGLELVPDENNEEVHFMIIGTDQGIETALRRLNGELQ